MDEQKYLRPAEGQQMTIKLAAGASQKILLDTNLEDLAFSARNNCVTVDGDGVITGIKQGMAVIDVYSMSRPACKINVVVTVV